MLVELGVVEQRYQAVLEVLNGASVTEVARRYGVVRQTVHGWLRRYASDGLAGWRMGARSRRPVPIRCRLGWRGGSSSCDGLTLRGGRGRSVITWRRRGWGWFLPVRRSIGVWFATACWTRRRGGSVVPTIAVGSGGRRWSCGRWTLWAESGCPMAPS